MDTDEITDVSGSETLRETTPSSGGFRGREGGGILKNKTSQYLRVGQDLS